MLDAWSRPILCMVTDRRRLVRPGDERGGGTDERLETLRLERLLALAVGAADAGVRLIQVRESGLGDRQLLAFTRQLVAAVGARARVVVNDRLDVALASRAAGVHLRGDSFPAPRLRAIAPPGFLIGRSVHRAAEARAAEDGGVDYVIMGTVFATSSKPPGAPLAGLQGLEAACTAVKVPVLAIGGVTADNLRDVAAAGAAGIAGIGLFADAAARGAGGLRAIVEAAARAFADVEESD
jgi:thiamine-phosphate pyrophosphorylase